MRGGARAPGAHLAATAPHHSAAAYFDDGVLADGTALYAELALRRLAAGGKQADRERAGSEQAGSEQAG